MQAAAAAAAATMTNSNNFLGRKPFCVGENPPPKFHTDAVWNRATRVYENPSCDRLQVYSSVVPA
jgi:hypothetical protein